MGHVRWDDPFNVASPARWQKSNHSGTHQSRFYHNSSIVRSYSCRAMLIFLKSWPFCNLAFLILTALPCRLESWLSCVFKHKLLSSLLFQLRLVAGWGPMRKFSFTARLFQYNATPCCRIRIHVTILAPRMSARYSCFIVVYFSLTQTICILGIRWMLLFLS